jgi:hypothetical protein
MRRDCGGGEWPEMPQVRDDDRSSILLGEGDKHCQVSGGFHNVIASDVDEYHFLCPEYGKILFDDIGVAGKFLRGQPIREDDVCSEDE